MQQSQKGLPIRLLRLAQLMVINRFFEKLQTLSIHCLFSPLLGAAGMVPTATRCSHSI